MNYMGWKGRADKSRKLNSEVQILNHFIKMYFKLSFCFHSRCLSTNQADNHIMLVLLLVVTDFPDSKLSIYLSLLSFFVKWHRFLSHTAVFRDPPLTFLPLFTAHAFSVLFVISYSYLTYNLSFKHVFKILY